MKNYNPKQNSKPNLTQIITDLQHLEDMDRQDIEQQKILKLQLSRIENLKKEYSKKEQEICRLEQQVEQFRIYYDKYENVKKLLESALEQLEKIENQNKSLQKKLSDFQESYAKLELTHQTLLVDYNNVIMEKEVNQISQNTNLRLELNDLKSQYNQKIQHMEAEIQKYKQTIQEREMQNNNLTIQLNTQTKQMLQYKQQSKNVDLILKNHLNSTKQQHNSYHQSICDTEIYKEDQTLKILCSQLTQDYDEAVKRIQQFERQLTEYRTENLELKKYIQYLTDK
ncbi:unnamed protein product (macronuclear) [Paramecium tetraurelia]|uniref:Uncharacterized protein n=1 Tax=Paramecium tetraurelia TaxID=5888 RepID=A0DTL5_PARTE|nr:uncharacterized protein GSPATT00020063001 [Paramecium tetraurelia]CAK86382.1 unnamed protein product [Paramecium tetraurelia]|eukprot:XP_001453779.1 hypothetical protein (macronuclear) [Paramecium tetraurelia strain d4-2]